MDEASLYPDLGALESRYAVFVNKLADRGADLVAEVLPQIKELMGSHADDAAGVVDRVKMAVNRQLASLNDKAYQVYNDEIVHPGGVYPRGSAYYAFRDACYGRFAALEAMIRQWRDEIDEAARPDYEAELVRIRQEFEALKGTYRCGQCGAPLPVDHIFFIDVYLACPQCGTQNHFAPSAGARRLDFISRPLAERRHADMLAASHPHRHQIALLEAEWRSRIGRAEAGDQAARAELRQLCQQMLAQRAEAEQDIRGYLVAVYNDMAALVPDHTAHYQQQYQQDLNTYLAGIVDDGARIDEMVQRTSQLG